MPAVCQALGLRFDYPENWQLEQFVDPLGGGEVVVTSPETAFFQVSRHPNEVASEELFDEALAALRAEYGEIEAHGAAETIGGRHLTGYDVNFYCLDLTSTCRLRYLSTEQAGYLIMDQAEDRELERVGPVFTAMLTSLLRHIDSPP